ncbi:sulfite exporter TauE/SafE family protein [Leptospira ognonensis]|uniref:Probable membrane transporter protein n=1 Tax=Leptospira ognonensis TaxID=2484945 RepID=A0A4R9JVK5_9LEPT|nr:sulfite exporter TauE/SafE family protein [Leptospira ognonensis]TGL56376.1 sulfite exporter TauE/SafE family protein [Leptospira ognonensis]
MDFQIFHEFVFGFYPGILSILLVGFFVGYLSSFLGIGGGFIYTPFFHTFFHLSAVQAVAVSLAQMPISSLSGLLVYIKNRKVRFKEGFILLLTSIPSAQLVAYKFGRFEETEFGRKLFFGLPVSELAYLFIFTFFLSILGVWNLISAKRKKQKAMLHSLSRDKDVLKEQTSAPPSMTFKSILFLLGVGVAFGATSSLLGIGGGFLAVPLFVYYFKMEPVEAVATSFLGIFFTSFGTSILLYSQGKLHIELALVGTIGGFIGARFGSLKAIHAKPYTILYILGSMQLLVVAWYLVSKLLKILS